MCLVLSRVKSCAVRAVPANADSSSELAARKNWQHRHGPASVVTDQNKMFTYREMTWAEPFAALGAAQLCQWQPRRWLQQYCADAARRRSHAWPVGAVCHV